ncbi:MAG: hypothetical protein KGJ57_11125 [Sphingomonadales bacterium]|nr:hypothetical protein [Sphingomonadales bacterium]MDE2169966.1 hypothetical protein [Sphingomonadales bacterium]
MQSAPADFQDSVESTLCAGLARGDGVLGGVGAVLRHMLVADDQDYFADDILATLRGMIADVARQLAGERGHGEALLPALLEVPGLIACAHALAVEGQLTRRLRETQGLDPVLSPLLQALIASPSAEVAALAMQVLAAQARFMQQQRRMQWPLMELPAELLHGALHVLHGDGMVAGDRALRLRDGYDEGATRSSLLARLTAQMGPGSLAALELAHAGVALFATALAGAGEQSRDQALLSMLSRHAERLALGLRAGGLPVGGVEAVLLQLHPGMAPIAGLGRLDPERALRLLRHPAPFSGEVD